MDCYCIVGYCPLLLFFWGLSCFQLVLPSPTVPSQNLESKLKCHPSLTIEVLGEPSQTGLRAFGYHFSEGYFQRINYTHFRVCICKVTKCMRKCCGPGQALYNRTCINGYDFPLHPNIYDEYLQRIYNYDFSKFVTVYGDTCSNGRFQLRPDREIEDTHFFLENGSLYLPHVNTLQIQETEDFCMEHALQKLDASPSEANIMTVVCFPRGDSEPVPPLLPIGMIISAPFLLGTFLVYSLPELRNLHGKNLMSHVGSLLIGYIILVVVQMVSTDLPNNVCIAFGYLIQYSFLSSFFWLNVMCFDIWWAFSCMHSRHKRLSINKFGFLFYESFRNIYGTVEYTFFQRDTMSDINGFAPFKGEKRSTDLKKYLLYSLYAWGCPAVISIVTVVMQFAPGIPNKLLKPDIGDHRCFFTDERAKLAYFYGPTAVILLCDVVLFILAAVKIISVKKQTVAVFKGKDSRRNREASKQRYKLYLKLFLIMGVNWITEVISWAVSGPRWVWYLTDLANSLQGVFVFITFVCTNRVKKLLIARLCPHFKTSEPETNSSVTKMSVSRNSSNTSTARNDVIVPMQTLASRKISS